ncbi:hypothetical protein PRIPAC_90375 [Pristionchus pacificus]|uniref:Uncharacterized protein n=1 Tax=Pristionchus pacificus TaxID=54126 RepID=A0A2A6B8Z7_PRIPA|nr:hypothetical protein PRIPAC_90375 [Pristionchus pacificus]|eukprot:PDM62337.1 hypothetical protein PRIPAC_51779 [Pristionchus pacificus]
MSSAEYYLDGPPDEVVKERAEGREATPLPSQLLETTPRAARVGGSGGGLREGGGRRTNRFPLERQYAESGTSTPERRSSETGEELERILGRRSRTSTASSVSSTTLEKEKERERYAPGCTSCGLSAAALPPPIPIPMRREKDELSSPLSCSPATGGLPPPLPTTPTSRHSANSSPHTEHSPHSGQLLQRANRPSPILLKHESSKEYSNKLVSGC